MNLIKKVNRGLDVIVQCSIMNVTLVARAGATPTNNLKYRKEGLMKLNDSISTYDVADALTGRDRQIRSDQPQRRTLFRYVPARTLHC
jgi:hypothetical protein